MEPRVFVSRRAVHGTDVGLDGRLRLDALARYLQAAAEGDLAGAGYRSTYAWVVRRCAVRARTYPRLGQRLQVRTFCSAIGPRWAERTTTLSDAGSGAELVRAAAEDAAAGLGWLPAVAEVEFHRPALPGCEPRLLSSASPAEAWAWLLTDGQRLASARLSAR